MSQSRAQSSVVGVALLLGFTVLVVGATVAIGYGAISSSTDAVAVNQAENALSQFDSAASEVALGSSDARRVDLGATDEGVRVSDAGRLSVTVTNLSTGTSKTLVNESLGAVVFSRGDRTVAYQGGGVWRGGQVVSPPEVHYNNGTLTLPVVTVGGDVSGSDLLVRRDDDPVRVFPAGNYSNPFTGMRVSVTVSGPYYEGWASFFRERTGGTVSVSDARESTTMTLTNPLPPARVDAGIVGESAGTTMQFYGNANIDGYNSSEGPYGESKGAPVNVSSVGPVDIASATIDGNIVADGPVHLDWGSEVTGTIYTNAKVTHPDYYGDVPPVVSGSATPTSLPPATGEIYSSIEDARTQNDNASDETIQDGTLNCGQNTDPDCALGAGTYYLDELTVGNGNTLTVNTTGGDVTFAVDGEVDISNGQSIEIYGPGRVTVYTTGNASFTQSGYVEVRNRTTGDRTYRAPAFWLYTLPDKTVDFSNSGGFTGVAYGAGTDSQPGSYIDVAQSGHIYGALVGDVNGIHNGGYLHYDNALSSSRTAMSASGSQTSTVNFLHVSIERVNVTDARAG